MTEKGIEKGIEKFERIEKTVLPAHRPRRRGSRAGVAARTQPKPNRTESLFFKTKICAFWLEGRCLRGQGCKYAHGDNERHEEPDLTKTALCRKMLSGGVCTDPTCTYAHNRDELRSTADVYKTSMCTFFKYGRCQMGSSCRHAHFESELRSHKEIQALDMCKAINGEEHLEGDSDDDFLNEVDTKWERAITMPPAIGQQLPQQTRERAVVKGITPSHPNWADITEEAEEDDDDFFDDSLWARMSTSPAPTTLPTMHDQAQHSHLNNTMHRNGPGILEAHLARPDIMNSGPGIQVQMMPQNNAMHQGPVTMEQGASSGLQMQMQPQLVAVAGAPGAPQCQPNMSGPGMAGQQNFVQGVPNQQMQMMGGYNVANVANVPAMAIVVPVPVPVMVMPQQTMSSDGPGSPATSSGCGSTPMQQMPQQPQQMQQQPQQMQQQPQQMQQQPQQMQQQPQQMQQQQQSQQMQQQQQSQQMQLQAFLMPGHCGAQAREVNGGTPPGSIQTETKKDNMMRW